MPSLVSNLCPSAPVCLPPHRIGEGIPEAAGNLRENFSQEGFFGRKMAVGRAVAHPQFLGKPPEGEGGNAVSVEHRDSGGNQLRAEVAVMV